MTASLPPSDSLLSAAGIPELDIREMLRVLWRRRWLIGSTIAALMLVAGVILSLIPPRYTATVQVMVDPRQTNVLDVEQVLSGLPANSETILSEIEIITSRNLAQRVVSTAGLMRDPAFNRTLRQESWLGPLTRETDGQPPPAAPEAPAPAPSALVVEKFLDGLSARMAGRSRVINISYTAHSPEQAARLANLVAELYLVEQLEAKLEATRRASAWLSERLDELRSKSEAAELAAARFKNGQDDGGLNEAGQRNANAVAARQRSLEREAQASRALYETVLTRFKETTEQQGLEQADARLISRADVPERPSAPNKRLFLLLSLLAATAAALLLALVIEKIDSGFRSSDQIESKLGLPTLAMLPSLRSIGVREAITPEAYIVDKPSSTLAEAVRMLRTSLLLANVDQPPRVLLTTSALPGEGKTTVALALARQAALAGEKVILVDADIRRPRVHEALGFANETGLVDLLSGQASLDQVRRQSEAGGRSIDFISAGRHTPYATELIRSQQMRRLLHALAATYTLVIVDGPPVLPVADAKVLATMVERVLYVLRWNDTSREAVTHAVKQLREVDAKFAGAILNAVDVKRHAEYGYTDSGFYYGRYRKYYTD